MKRNHPPDGGAYPQDEQQIIGNKLSELYPRHYHRKVLYSSKAVWSSQHHHVHIDTATNTNQYDGLIVFSKDLDCVHLNPYEALFFIESRQLLVYHNELPLSLAEAYELMLRDKCDLREYVVFSHLNRSGYICLPHSSPEPTSSVQIAANSSFDCTGQTETSVNQPFSTNNNDSNRSLFEIDSLKLPFECVLEQLRRLGPQELKRADVAPNSKISFDVYKRSTFKQRKPRKDKPGRPDHFLVVCDRTTSTPPIAGAAAAVSETCTSLASDTRLLFALVEGDHSVMFARADSIGSDRLLLPRNYYWQEFVQDMQSDALF